MELKIKKELKTHKSNQQLCFPQFSIVEYSLDKQEASFHAPYYDLYTHSLSVTAKGTSPSGEVPDHSIARNGLMSFLYSDIIHELHILAGEISPRNTDALKRIRNMQHQLSSWD